MKMLVRTSKKPLLFIKAMRTLPKIVKIGIFITPKISQTLAAIHRAFFLKKDKFH